MFLHRIISRYFPVDWIFELSIVQVTLLAFCRHVVRRVLRIQALSVLIGHVSLTTAKLFKHLSAIVASMLWCFTALISQMPIQRDFPHVALAAELADERFLARQSAAGHRAAENCKRQRD